MNTQSKILQILETNTEARVNDLMELMGISRQMIHRAMKELMDQNKVIKLGTPPFTYYRLSHEEPTQNTNELLLDFVNFLNDHFLIITEIGKKLHGEEAMIHWCQRQKLPLVKTTKEYVKTREKYLAYYQDNQLIDGTKKIETTKAFERIGLDKVWYVDFYAIERFGKTNLGVLLHFAKQGQNRKLMNEIIDIIKVRIASIISVSNIQAVGYIPPTIKREVQIMHVFRKKLNLNLPHIDLKKVVGEIAIPQKALNKIEDRIANANASIMINEKRKFGKVLLIDDAVGSGATLNQTALKLKDKGIAKEVIGLAVTGSFKGFEVIQEV